MSLSLSISKFSLENSVKIYKDGLSQKGKHASSTESRRFVLENVIWPIILDKNSNCFTLQEYHFKRNKVCKNRSISLPRVSGGIVSLLAKGILVREGRTYFIHHKLTPYMRKKKHLDYGKVLKEIRSKK